MLRVMASELQAAVAICAKVADRGKIPILAAIRLQTDGSGMVELCATDTAQTVLARIACDGEASFCIDAQSLELKVKTLRPGEAIIDDNGQEMTIASGRTKWTAPILPAKDFIGDLAKRVEGETHIMPATFTADMVRVHRHADDKIERIMGVCIDGDQMIATTGKTLGIIGGLTMRDFRATLPSSAIGRLALLGEGELRFTVNRRMAMFETDHVALITRMLEEQFPDYKRVLPTLPNSTTVDRAEFMAAISRASALKSGADKESLIGVSMTIGEDEISLSALNGAGERGDDYVRHGGREGPQMTFGFIRDRLMLALDAIPHETLRIFYDHQQFNDQPPHMRPLRFEPVAPVGRTDFVVVMPYQLKNGFIA